LSQEEGKALGEAACVDETTNQRGVFWEVARGKNRGERCEQNPRISKNHGLFLDEFWDARAIQFMNFMGEVNIIRNGRGF